MQGAKAGSKGRVLIADDLESLAQTITWVLEGEGYQTAMAHDGEECLELARSFAPQLIILDLIMPKLHGIQVLKRLKADPATRNIPVVICTVKGFRTEIHRAKELGAADLIIKPFEPRELVATVAGILAARHTSATETGKLLKLSAAAEAAARYQPQIETGGGILHLWGTRGSIPISGPECIRHGGNTSCMSFEHQGEMVIFDAGSGIRALGLELAAGAPRRLHLFITHTHWDHIQGFPFFAPAFVPGFEITIYGARGFNKNLEALFRGQFDSDYFPIQMENMEAKLEFVYLDDEPVRIGAMTISWEFTQHPGATLGYKIALADKTVAFVPDNEAFQGYFGPPEGILEARELLTLYRPIIDFLRGVDLLIHEAQYTSDEYRRTAHFGHSCTPNACGLVRIVEARRWIVIHHDPNHSDNFLRDKLNLTRQFLDQLAHPIPVVNGYDGLVEVL